MDSKDSKLISSNPIDNTIVKDDANKNKFNSLTDIYVKYYPDCKTLIYFEINYKDIILDIYNGDIENLKKYETDDCDPNIKYLIGTFYSITLKDYESGIKYYQKALDGGCSFALNGLAFYYYSIKKDKEKALEYYKRGLETYNDFVIYGLGVYYFNEYDYDNAEKYLKLALLINKKNAYAHRIISYVYKVKQNTKLEEQHLYDAYCLGDVLTWNDLLDFYRNSKDITKINDCITKNNIIIDLFKTQGIYNVNTEYWFAHFNTKLKEIEAEILNNNDNNNTVIKDTVVNNTDTNNNSITC
jgi:tetratricopeptide (TPR) repeat protein